MNSAKQQRVSKTDVIGIVVCFVLIIGLLAISPHLPDERPGAIRRELSRQGYSVENIDFEFIKDGDRRGEWLFQSSVPLYSNGHYVNQWAVVRYERGFSGSHIRYIYHVEPYPALVNVNITFTTEEIERLAEYSDSQPIEGYLRQRILDGIDGHK